MISTRSAGLLIDTVVCLTLAKWETVSGRFGGYLIGEETHGLAITAIEREGDSHPFTVVAADLKAVGAPAAVALIDGDASVMAPLDAAGMAIKQEAVDLHHPVNPLVIGRR